MLTERFGRSSFLYGCALAWCLGSAGWVRAEVVHQPANPQAATAPAGRAAVLWSNDLIAEDFTPTSLAIWDNLFDFMLQGKASANVVWIPNRQANTPNFLASRLQANGHLNLDFDDAVLAVEEVDLLVLTDAASSTTASGLGDLEIPLITYNAATHNELLLSSVATVTSGGPAQIMAVADQQQHPILDGQSSGPLAWVDEVSFHQPLQGIGGEVPFGATVLATYQDPISQEERPALLLIEPGDPLYTTAAQTSLDCNADGAVTADDLDCSNAFGITDALLSELNLLPGDFDGQDGVRFSDYIIFAENFGRPTSKYTEGDINGRDGVNFEDYILFAQNFGRRAPSAAAASVPEPSHGIACFLLIGVGCWHSRRVSIARRKRGVQTAKCRVPKRSHLASQC